jgi:BON domain
MLKKKISKVYIGLLCIQSSLALGYMTPPLDSPRYIPVQNPRDHEITEDIQQAIKDDYYLAPYYPQISIQTYNGIVTLNGLIDSYKIKLKIEQKVKNVSGVKRVDDFIQVNTTPQYVPPL